MASSSSSIKSPCATCNNKGVGIFKCEGCSQTFCRRHSNEHRDFLSHRLDEIVIEYDVVQHTIVEYKVKQNDHHLIKQIDTWERDSIVKIQQTANDVRQHIKNLIDVYNDKISSKLHDLAEQLEKARTTDDFVETDLRQWKEKVQELEIDTTNVLTGVTMPKDPLIILIAKPNILSTSHQLTANESIVRVCGNVRIQDNNRMAIQCDSRGNSYIHGKNEYTFGIHKARYTLRRIDPHFLVRFGIIAKRETFSQWPSSFYG